MLVINGTNFERNFNQDRVRESAGKYNEDIYQDDIEKGSAIYLLVEVSRIFFD